MVAADLIQEKYWYRINLRRNNASARADQVNLYNYLSHGLKTGNTIPLLRAAAVNKPSDRQLPRQCPGFGLEACTEILIKPSHCTNATRPGSTWKFGSSASSVSAPNYVGSFMRVTSQPLRSPSYYLTRGMPL